MGGGRGSSPLAQSEEVRLRAPTCRNVSPRYKFPALGRGCHGGFTYQPRLRLPVSDFDPDVLPEPTKSLKRLAFRCDRLRVTTKLRASKSLEALVSSRFSLTTP
jgi:hypothetical protein